MNSDNIILSIIVPVYNNAEQIENCLKSIYMRQLKKTEVIVVNDGSEDGTEAIVREFISEKNGFFLYNKQNGGVSSARNFGLQVAKGKYVWFVDADDQILEKSSSILNFLENTDVDMVIFDSIYFNGIEKKVMKREKISKGLLGVNNVKQLILNDELDSNVWTHIYNKLLLDKACLKFEQGIAMGEDFIFNLRYVNLIKYSYYYPIAGYLYNSYTINSASKKYKYQYIFDAVKIFEEYEKIYNTETTLKWTFKDQYYINMIYQCFRKIKKHELKEFELNAFYSSKLYMYIKKRKKTLKDTIKFLYIQLQIYKFL